RQAAAEWGVLDDGEHYRLCGFHRSSFGSHQRARACAGPTVDKLLRYAITRQHLRQRGQKPIERGQGELPRRGMGVSHELDRIRAVYERRHIQPRGRNVPSSPGDMFILQSREKAILQLLRRNGIVNLTETRVLEVGCGAGKPLADWLRWG